MTETVTLGIERLLIGRSSTMQRLRRDVARLGASRLPVLVQGPTGSGKELVARGLHLASGRAGPMVAFNICAVPDSMFEDALFGHVKGAFTGANAETPGYLAEAHGGSVVLDEINGLSMAGQAKLLRAIEGGVFRPVGARRDRISDFRLIAASNTNLMEAVEAARFRADLFYRLSGLALNVPALSQRSEDIPDLVQYFLAADDDANREVSGEALDELSRYAWPGNVRELRYVVARASILAERRPIGAESVRAAIATTHSIGAVIAGRALDVRGELEALLRACRWDTTRVAEQLGVHRATVYRRMQRYGLDAGE